tara:strand:+ start:303 stop:809 length:507 start_codon:yes stop_codon:yes gene_type:complete
MNKSLHLNLRQVACVCGIALSTAVSSAIPSTSYGQTVSIEQNLSFGRFVMLDFTDEAQIIINPNGSVTKSSDILFIDEPQRGQYLVTNAPPNTTYTVTVPENDILVGVQPAGNFLLDNITVAPELLVTDAQGQDTFFLVGRLRSLGETIQYVDGLYDGNFEIELNFNN